MSINKPTLLVFAQTIAICAIVGCRTASKSDTTTRSAAPIAEAPVAPVTPPVVDQSMPAEEFAQAVACTDLLQIKLGKMAAQRAEEPPVKDLGQRMATNHTAIQAIIAKIATDQGITLPTELNAEDAATVTRLDALQGIDFDKAYMSFMAEVHPKTLAMFRWQYENCSNPALKSFASQTMPIVGTHTRLSDALNAEVNKEEIRLAAEKKAADLKAAEEARAQAALDAATAAAKKPAAKRGARKPAPAPE